MPNSSDNEIPELLAWSREHALHSALDGQYIYHIPVNPFVEEQTKTSVNIDDSDARVKRLEKLLRNEMRDRKAFDNIRFSRTADRREDEYLSSIKRDKYSRMTASEIVYSETPVYIEFIDWDKMREVALTGHRDVRDEGKTLVCRTCNTKTPSRYAAFCMGRLYCLEHLPEFEMCASCQQVRRNCSEVLSYDRKTIFVCPECVGRTCRRCHRGPVPLPYAAAHMCGSCVESVDENYPTRRYHRGTAWMNKTPGGIVQSERVFSAELEGVMPSSLHLLALAQRLPSHVGISGDGSIRTSSGMGIELQTPKLQGQRGEELITRIAAAAKKQTMSVNESCGMHIHLDAAGIIPPSRKLYPLPLIQLWATYLVFEDVLLSFLPYSRRNNMYCRPMRDYFKLSELEEVRTIFDLEKLWYKQQTPDNIRAEKSHGYHPSRYFGINLHSLFADGNLEIRYHTGTLNAKKVLHWVNLHTLIMDAAQKNWLDYDFLREALSTTSLREKTEMLFTRIGLSQKSQNYFRGRQQKFSNKSTNDNE